MRITILGQDNFVPRVRDIDVAADEVVIIEDDDGTQWELRKGRMSWSGSTRQPAGHKDYYFLVETGSPYDDALKGKD